VKKLAAVFFAVAFALCVPFAAMASCGDCGRVEKIDTVVGHRSTTGGMIAGAVVGGLVGNQIGKGSGKTVATVAGAAGGAYAGNKIAKNMEKTQYQVTVRMEDGHYETVVQNSVKNIHVGNSVRIRNHKVVRL